MANDDPRAPYKVYEGDEVKGSYPTRAEARRAQQRFAEAEPQQNFIIRVERTPQIRRGRLARLALRSHSCPASVGLFLVYLPKVPAKSGQ